MSFLDDSYGWSDLGGDTSDLLDSGFTTPTVDSNPASDGTGFFDGLGGFVDGISQGVSGLSDLSGNLSSLFNNGSSILGSLQNLEGQTSDLWNGLSDQFGNVGYPNYPTPTQNTDTGITSNTGLLILGAVALGLILLVGRK